MSPPLSKTLSNIFVSILSLCQRLVNLNFCQLSEYRSLSISICKLSSSCMSSTLSTLKINVATFNDCLYLLDGRLHCLSKLIIHVKKTISFMSSTIDNTVSIIFHYHVVRKNS